METTLEISGTTVRSARNYSAKRRGSAEYDAFLSSLSSDERQLLERPVGAGEWVDVRTYAGMLEKAAANLSPDAPEDYLRAGGKFIVDEGVNTLYRAFFAIARPSFVLRGSALMWRRFFRGSRLVVKRSSRTSVVVHVQGPFCSRALCTSISGGMMSSLAHGGARDLQIDHHRCQSDGGPASCEHAFSWR